jgi:hypothetical protein
MLASMRASTDRKISTNTYFAAESRRNLRPLSAEIYEVQRMVLSSHTAIVDSTAK